MGFIKVCQIFSMNDLLIVFQVFILGFECLECKIDILHWKLQYLRNCLLCTHSTGLYIFN